MTEKHKPFRESVDRRLSSVELRPDAKERIKAAAALEDALQNTPYDRGFSVEPGGQRHRPHRVKRRLAATVAAAVLVVVFSLGVTATVFGGFDRFIQRMGEDMRELVQPVELVDSSEGITMEVLAAIADGENAVIYLSLTDDTGSRIDESTELYSVDVGDLGHCWGPQVDFDTETGTATYRLEVAGYNKDLGGQQVPLRLSSILTGCQGRQPVDLGITVADVMAANPSPETFTYTPHGPNDPGDGSYGMSHGEKSRLDPDALAARIDAGQLPLLVQGSAPMATGGESWVEITAIGVVEEMLHILYAPKTEAARYAHSQLAVNGDQDQSYENSLLSINIPLGPAEMEGNQTIYPAYTEIIELPVDVPYDKMRLTLGGYTCEEHIAGDWQVDFTLEESPSILAADVELAFEGYTIHRVELGRIGVQAFGTGDFSVEKQAIELEVWLKDGTKVKIDSAQSSSGSDGAVSARENFARPLDLDQVDKVLLNGQPLELTLEQ